MKLRPVHRARRFARTLVARRPRAADLEWASSYLSEAERRLFAKMSTADRAHSIQVARAVESNLDRLGLRPGDEDARWILTAALTHDVGKTVAGLGTYGRVMATLSAAAGGAGMITPDLIPDEASEWIAASDETGLDRVFLVAPSSTPERIAAVTAQCRGFVYAVSHMGVTGARASMGDAAKVVVERTKAVTDKPVCVGLGVAGGEQAAEVAAYADGVIVGSALVRCLADAPDEESGIASLRSLVGELAEGVRGGR